MRDATSTTRQRIHERLRTTAATPSALAEEFGVTASVATDHVRHLARSLDHTDEDLLVAPPECLDCGFTEFDDLLNRPSRCPACNSENVSDPAFRVE